jgi:hypothetical protein
VASAVIVVAAAAAAAAALAVPADARVLGKTRTREMLHWLHYDQHKAQQLGARVHLKNSGKHFKCLGYHYKIDRDWNGGRNNMLMNLERCVGTVKLPSCG